MTETTWARIGLALLFGLVTATVVLIALNAPRIIGLETTLAILFGIAAGCGIYIYDSRTEVPNE
jgi:hypothetical protein